MVVFFAPAGSDPLESSQWKQATGIEFTSESVLGSTGTKGDVMATMDSMNFYIEGKPLLSDGGYVFSKKKEEQVARSFWDNLTDVYPDIAEFFEDEQEWRNAVTAAGNQIHGEESLAKLLAIQHPQWVEDKPEVKTTTILGGNKEEQ